MSATTPIESTANASISTSTPSAMPAFSTAPGGNQPPAAPPAETPAAPTSSPHAGTASAQGNATPPTTPASADGQGNTQTIPRLTGQTEETAGEGSGGEGAAPPAADAPIPFPDGYEPSEAEVAVFRDVARDAGLTPAQNQTLAKLHVEHVQKALRAREQELAVLKQKHGEEIRSDPDFGGARLSDTMRHANDAIRRYGPELVSLLAEWNVESHPAVIRFLARIGARDAENRSPRDVTPPSAARERTLEDVIGTNLTAK